MKSARRQFVIAISLQLHNECNFCFSCLLVRWSDEVMFLQVFLQSGQQPGLQSTRCQRALLLQWWLQCNELYPPAAWTQLLAAVSSAVVALILHRGQLNLIKPTRTRIHQAHKCQQLRQKKKKKGCLFSHVPFCHYNTTLLKLFIWAQTQTEENALCTMLKWIY